MEELRAKLKDWTEKNRLRVEFVTDRVFKIGEESFFLIPERRQSTKNIMSVFTDRLDLNVSLEDEEYARKVGVKNYCFQFGNNFYYTPENTIENPKLNILKYIGKAVAELELDYSFLGLRGKYELCNGTGNYEDWVQKAKFMGVKSLGIAEHNTLAGALHFQQKCKKAGMHFILGETFSVRDSNFKEYQVKCYVTSEEGWWNLLYINKTVNVDNVESQLISEEDLLKYGKGLIIVLDSEAPLSTQLIAKYQSAFVRCFYQLDLTEYRGEDKEHQRLESQKIYLQHFIDKIDPILIQDAFYLDEEYSHAKKVLNKIGSVKFQFESKNQWFKSIDEIFGEWSSLFKEDDSRLFNLLISSIENTMWVSGNCNYEIETGVRHLPKFEHDTGEDNEHLFLRLIDEGLERRGFTNNQEYLDRVQKELSVIRKGKVVDYFLILWDIVEWCKPRHILTGVGRGSAAGSLISYLLGITGLDPIEYGLLFERFLNEGRVKTSLPDIDLDFPAKRREEVKRYMENKYGVDYVCSVGTYGTFKLRSAIKDVGKQFGLGAQDSNYIVSSIGDDGRYSSGEFIDLFGESLVFPPLKEYILKKPHVIDTARLVLKQPKNASVHPCATLILPKLDQHGRERNIYNWIPVKSVDGVLVSEWEGGELEDAGFLKEDILGIKQLDKFSDIFNRVKANRGIDLAMDSVDLENEEVYDLFRQGISGDVFHFGSRGLTSYAQEVNPFNLDEMIAMISLYRPGPIESNIHTDYVKLKYGLKEVEYDFMLEEVTKDTYGLFVYQEQVMLAVQKLGGFDLVTADDIRKAMGKMSMKLIKEYRVQFVAGAVKNGCDEITAETIWNKLEAFAKYGFNKSHAAAYSYTGVMCQWLKVKFPIEFWTTTMEYSDDKTIPSYVAEINKLDNGVSIVPPNVNKSDTEFISDFSTGNIYWAINKIKWVGDAATECIIEERREGGEFSSIEDFYTRVNTTKVNKRVIEHLIFSGAFDEIHNIDIALTDRRELFNTYYFLAKVKEKDQFQFPTQSNQNWYWTAKQKELSGLGHFNFPNIIMRSGLQELISVHMDAIKLQVESSVGKRAVICGLVKDKKIRRTKKGDEFCALVIDSNGEEIHFLLWPDKWAQYKVDFESSDTNLFLGSGTVHIDNYKKCNCLQSDKNTKVEVH